MIYATSPQAGDVETPDLHLRLRYGFYKVVLNPNLSL